MKLRTVYGSVAFAVTAVLLQTTFFARVRPFEVAPDLVLLVVVIVALYVDAEIAVLIGFTGGLLTDLLGNTLLGIWALVLTVIAFLTVRFRDRAEGNLLLTGAGIVALSISGALLFAILGTLFGQQVFSDVLTVRKIFLPALYNLILAIPLVPLIARVVRVERSAAGWS